MGYRSDVCIAISGPKESIVKLLVDYRLKNSEAYNNHVKPEMCVTENGDEVCLVFSFDNVKWYAGYKDVDCFEELYRMAEEAAAEDEECGLSGQRICIGEDDNDIETDSFGDQYDLLSVQRAIQIDIRLDNNPALIGLEV